MLKRDYIKFITSVIITALSITKEQEIINIESKYGTSETIIRINGEVEIRIKSIRKKV